MHRYARIAGFLLLMSVSAFSGAAARSSSHHSSRSYGKHPYSPHALPGVPRDRHGRIKRSESAKREFEKESGYPHGRPGYVVDHIIPLSRGGSDTPSNMQWQTKEEARAKDKVELGPHPTRSHKKKHA